MIDNHIVHIMVDKWCTDTGGGYQGYYYDTLMEVVPKWMEKDFPNECSTDCVSPTSAAGDILNKFYY